MRPFDSYFKATNYCFTWIMSISTDEVNLSLYFYTSIMFLLVLLAVSSINIEYVV